MRPGLHQPGAFRKHLHAFARVYPASRRIDSCDTPLASLRRCATIPDQAAPPASCSILCRAGTVLPSCGGIGRRALSSQPWTWRARASTGFPIQVICRRQVLAKVGKKQAVRLQPVGAILHRPLESGGIGVKTAQHVVTYHDVCRAGQFHVAHVCMYELVDFGVAFLDVYPYRAGPDPCLRKWRCTSCSPVPPPNPTSIMMQSCFLSASHTHASPYV